MKQVPQVRRSLGAIARALAGDLQGGGQVGDGGDAGVLQAGGGGREAREVLRHVADLERPALAGLGHNIQDLFGPVGGNVQVIDHGIGRAAHILH